MDIVSMLASPVVGVVAPLIGGVMGWEILKFLYKGLKLKQNLNEYAPKMANKAALEIYKHVISKVKDDALRNQIINDLDEVGDAIDDAWDAGLAGIKI
jgi:hypothetical protein